MGTTEQRNQRTLDDHEAISIEGVNELVPLHNPYGDLEDPEDPEILEERFDTILALIGLFTPF